MNLASLTTVLADNKEWIFSGVGVTAVVGGVGWVWRALWRRPTPPPDRQDRQSIAQSGGSIAYQAGTTLTINQGPGYGEIKQICEDLYALNAPKLAEQAASLATNRIRDLSEAVGKRLSAEARRQ